VPHSPIEPERDPHRLEPGQREALLLNCVERLSYEEMTTVAGVGVSALKMHVQQACEPLQSLLREERYA
jgi:DNA-directed RNA polymerase specialized sigma24 family protein